jgi:hypothetical protein
MSLQGLLQTLCPARLNTGAKLPLGMKFFAQWAHFIVLCQDEKGGSYCFEVVPADLVDTVALGKVLSTVTGALIRQGNLFFCR